MFFEASEDGTLPKVVYLDADALKHEPTVKSLLANGHQLHLLREGPMRDLAKLGWRPVTKRDVFGRPTIFMDLSKQRLLVHRPPRRAEECKTPRRGGV